MEGSILSREKRTRLRAHGHIGGKGTACRKKKGVHRTASAGDKNLQLSLQKRGVSNISGIEEVNMFTNEGTVIDLNSPKGHAPPAVNTGCLTVHTARPLEETSRALPQQPMDGKAPFATGEEEDEVPALLESFEEVSKNEANLNRVNF
ncbi:transcription factor BTF3-like [Phyllostomus discolor]|uniref:Transcription factor BTF3 n=1 Tax=Phyllostomus discolor TaxID=89673 RepID=A0A7E6EFG0_9CHIR|nr:transcription factor BTF3-like [Phyllostomus discolor]